MNLKTFLIDVCPDSYSLFCLKRRALGDRPDRFPREVKEVRGGDSRWISASSLCLNNQHGCLYTVLFIKPYKIQFTNALGFGKVLWNWYYIKSAINILKSKYCCLLIFFIVITFFKTTVLSYWKPTKLTTSTLGGIWCAYEVSMWTVETTKLTTPFPP